MACAAIEEIDGGVPGKLNLMPKQSKPVVKINKDNDTIEEIIENVPYFRTQISNTILYSKSGSVN